MIKRKFRDKIFQNRIIIDRDGGRHIQNDTVRIQNWNNGQQSSSQCHRSWVDSIPDCHCSVSCLQVNAHLWLVDTKLYSSMIGWPKTMLTSDWLTKLYTYLWLVDTMLVFSVLYVIWYRSDRPQHKAHGTSTIAVLGLFMTLVTTILVRNAWFWLVENMKYSLLIGW